MQHPHTQTPCTLDYKNSSNIRIFEIKFFRKWCFGLGLLRKRFHTNNVFFFYPPPHTHTSKCNYYTSKLRKNAPSFCVGNMQWWCVGMATKTQLGLSVWRAFDENPSRRSVLVLVQSNWLRAYSTRLCPGGGVVNRVVVPLLALAIYRPLKKVFLPPGCTVASIKFNLFSPVQLVPQQVFVTKYILLCRGFLVDPWRSHGGRYNLMTALPRAPPCLDTYSSK